MATVQEIVEKLEQEYGHWNAIKEYGCNDPFWADGCNMNLIRNHISAYKRELLEICGENAFPDIYYRALPPEVDENYMAKKGEYFKERSKSIAEQFSEKLVYNAPDENSNGSLF